MNAFLENKITKKYPELFTNDAFGFECDNGWFNIINNLCASILSPLRTAERNLNLQIKYAGKSESYTNKSLLEAEQMLKAQKDLIPKIEQVKEKYGTLRFYTNFTTERIDTLIEYAELMSACTCEKCGAPGIEYPIGWIRTLCHTHAVEQHGLDKVTIFEEKIT